MVNRVTANERTEKINATHIEIGFGKVAEAGGQVVLEAEDISLQSHSRSDWSVLEWAYLRAHFDVAVFERAFGVVAPELAYFV